MSLLIDTSFLWNETVWNPSMISTALWLDAADATTLFTTDSGSTLATNGSAVGRWNDKSGNTRNATQATAGSRPLFAAAGLNGKAAIDCDGTNDELSLANITSLTSVNQSLFVVAKRDNAAGRTEVSIAIGNASTSDSVADTPRWIDNVMYSQVGYAANRPTPISVITDQPYISSVTGGAIQLSYTNGTLIGTGTTQSTSSFSVTHF